MFGDLLIALGLRLLVELRKARARGPAVSGTQRSRVT